MCTASDWPAGKRIGSMPLLSEPTALTSRLADSHPSSDSDKS
jgi:hypothetical protein